MMERATAVSVCLLVLAGCGGAASPLYSRSASNAVEREYARLLLANRENVERSPTDAEVSDLVDKGVRANCKLHEGTSYDCVIEVPGFGSYGCTADVVDGKASHIRCGSARDAPRATAGYVDCATVGPVVRVSDPTGDTFSYQRAPDGTLTHVDGPGVDLVGAGVAVGHNRLCADLEFETDPDPNLSITLMADNPAPTQQPVEGLSATVRLTGSGGPEVTTLNHGAISAQVGTSGRTLSVVIESSALTPALQYLFRDQFMFAFHTGLVSVSAQQSQTTPQDELPDDGNRPLYG